MITMNDIGKIRIGGKLYWVDVQQDKIVECLVTGVHSALRDANTVHAESSDGQKKMLFHLPGEEADLMLWFFDREAAHKWSKLRMGEYGPELVHVVCSSNNLAVSAYFEKADADNEVERLRHLGDEAYHIQIPLNKFKQGNWTVTVTVGKWEFVAKQTGKVVKGWQYNGIEWETTIPASNAAQAIRVAKDGLKRVMGLGL